MVDPILDHQQVFDGKAVRLTTLNKLRGKLRAGIKLDDSYVQTLEMLFDGKLSGSNDQKLRR